MYTTLAIAMGGAIGAVLRHFVNSGAGHLFGTGFPVGILFCNVFGSFLMGVMITTGALIWDPPQALKAALAVGVLGAFTTFSTFSLDTVTLLERGAIGYAAFYALSSVVCSIAALFFGMWLIRTLV